MTTGRLRKQARKLYNRMQYDAKALPYRLQGKSIVHILHIGKTGGSAVNDALRANLDTRTYKIELHGHGFALDEVPVGDKVVFLVRDPISRFVSGFFSRKRMGEPRYHIPWSPGEAAAFRSFGTPNELAIALSSEDSNTRESAVQAMKSIQHVNSSYWDWFGTEEYFLARLPDILFIGFQETLDSDFLILRQKLNLSESIELP